MLELSTEILSRVQFAFTITFHIIFPTLNIGLGMFLVYWEAIYLQTGSELYLKLCQFWTKIFALSFGMGVVSGVVLAFQLGANFSGFTHFSGNILGPLIMMETMTAFFLEAGFLGIMLFGWKKVSKRAHFFATCMVSLGTVISLLWIMSANSFMQFPTGYRLEEGVMVATAWREAIFNPMFISRALHMLLASVLTTSFVILGISCYYFKHQKHVLYASASFFPALYVACLLSLAQLGMGDRVGLDVLKYQPIKTAAIEANWDTQKGAPLILFAIPDMGAEKNHFEIKIPKLASFINTHDFNGELPGLKSVLKSQRPHVASVFFSFRIMVGIGLWFILLSFVGLFWSRHRRLIDAPWLLNAFIFSVPLGFIATISGWFTSELGRQPWVIYQVLKTKDAVSAVPAVQVLTSLVLLFLLYAGCFVMYLFFMRKTICKGPLDLSPSVGLGYMVDAIGMRKKHD